MSALAHVLEAEGFATVALSLVRGQAAATAPPRALHCRFPLGRPLGRPNDPAFQRRVLEAALATLTAPSGPVLVDFPDVINAAQDSDIMACTLPPAEHRERHPAAAEALALRPAFERAGSAVEVAVDPDAIPALLDSFTRIAEGHSARDVNLSDPRDAALRIRAYYERAARALADHVPAARASENWFFHHTAAGATILAARNALSASGADRTQWFYLAPASWKATRPSSHAG